MLRIVLIAVLLLSPSFDSLSLNYVSASMQKLSELKAAPMHEPHEAPGSSISDSAALPTVEYCALIEGSRRYAGKLVRVSAAWKFGFETTVVFDRKCPERPGAWLEFVDDKDSCPETKKNREAPGTHDKEADVTVTGRLVGPGRYGHLGAYEYKFVVRCLEKIKITATDLK